MPLASDETNKLNNDTILNESSLYSSKVKTVKNRILKEVPSSSKPTLKKTHIINVDKSATYTKNYMKKDKDGFITVTSRKTTTGTRKQNGALRGAKRTVDLYIGRCDDGVNEDDMKDYIKNELNIESLKCEKLSTRIPLSTAFKVTVKLEDRPHLLKGDSWPEGIICRRFYSPKI